MEMIEFKDRESNYPNRRKLKIISQAGNEMIADIEFADEATEQGTPITAGMMNGLQQNVADAVETAEFAKTMAQEANDRVLSGMGTQVSSGGTEQLTWDADTKVDKSQGTSNVNKTLVVDGSGNVVPSNYIYIGNIKVYQDTEGIAFEFPDEV